MYRCYCKVSSLGSQLFIICVLGERTLMEGGAAGWEWRHSWDGDWRGASISQAEDSWEQGPGSQKTLQHCPLEAEWSSVP